MSKVKRASAYIFVFILLFLCQQTASILGGNIANALGLTADDPSNPFLWVSVHHIVQLLVGLLFVYGTYKVCHIRFYLKPRHDKFGDISLIIFTVVILIITVVGYRLMYPSFKSIFFYYRLNAKNMAGVLAFQILLSGPSEEIIFRALPIMALIAVSGAKESKTAQWAAVIAAAVLFSLGHISWGLKPFYLSFSWFQLGYCFLYGLAYGFIYLKTKTVVYPMLMHSISNLIMVGMGYVLKLLA